MEAPEHGVRVEGASVVTAVKVPAASKKNSWKTKYLILKGKCDQIDQVSCKPSLEARVKGGHVFVLQQSSLCLCVRLRRYCYTHSKCSKCSNSVHSMFLSHSQSNDVLYAKSRQIYKMIQRAEMEKK